MNRPADQDTDTRLQQLRRRAELYRNRYGEIDELQPLERLDNNLAGRRARLEHLRRTAAEIDAEIRSFELEIAGIERAVEALLDDTIPQIASRYREAWSPTPILGFRLWAVGSDGFHGVRARWEEPQLIAECETTGDGDDLPHTDGRCGRLGCGIYIAKNATALLAEFTPALSSSFAAGLVALEGKVVEHKRGYRGARARVVALAAVERMRIETTDDPDRITELFSGSPIHPGGAISSPEEGHGDRSELYRIIVSYLAEREGSHASWTSENKSAS